MLRIQVIPRGDANVYQILRQKIDSKARTFAWADKKKISIVNIGRGNPGQIRICDADGILVAHTEDGDLIIGAFIARLVDWFSSEIAAINIQLVQDTTKKKGKKK